MADAGRSIEGLRILAIDDSASARKVFQGVLTRLGVTLPDLRFASSAPEALQLFTQWRPDLVFVDIDLRTSPARPAATTAPATPVAPPSGGMGEVDGDELAKVLLQRNPHLRLVVVTAYDSDHPRVKSLLAQGASEVIVKPVMASRVQEVLQKALIPPDRRRAPTRSATA
ncbi:MAG TPA: response regulator [Thermoplasmata archaeon]|nr:response regulator [Thermoplasmata archaeon]